MQFCKQATLNYTEEFITQFICITYEFINQLKTGCLLFLLVFCLVCASTLQIGAICYSETSVTKLRVL
jgi:hypothetical protein